jgi:hypothetical protein
MSDKAPGYGARWKKWLAIYVAVGIVVYLAVYLLFFHAGGGAAGGGGFGY